MTEKTLHIDNKCYLLVTILILIFSSGIQAKQFVYPKKHWKKWTKQDNQYLSVEEAVEKLKSMDTTSFMIIIGGKVYFEYGDVSEISYTASVRKSILSMLYGKYVSNGKINLDKTLVDLNINDIGGLLPIEKQASLRHLVTATSGVYHTASNGGDDTANAPTRGSKKPGSYFLYNNWDFNVAGGIFEQLTHQNIYDVFQKDLATPLKMEDFSRHLQHKSGDNRKSIYPAYYFWLSTRDMARIGYLMLRNGNWQGKQLIPKQWIATITTPVTVLELISSKKLQDENLFDFGYLWWIWRKDNNRPWLNGAYTARGAYGQFISIFPLYDAVIVHKTSVNKSAKQAWNKYMTNHKLSAPKRSNVSMKQYMELLDILFMTKIS